MIPHLLIPHAAARDQHDQSLWPAQVPRELPHLSALLPLMSVAEQVDAGPECPSMPYELVLAALLGLPASEGQIPWAALETRTTGQPCGWIRPCHLQVGSDQVRLGAPEQLDLQEAESRALFEAAQPYFEEDGIALRYVMPHAWLAMGEPLRGLTTWSLDRLAGRPITPAVLHFSGHPEALRWRRLQNEMQMLFYAHRVNDDRQQRRLPLINALWVTGAGLLEALPPPAPQVQVENRLQASALALDARAYVDAWQAVDGDSVARLLAEARRGTPVRLTLAGEQRAITLVASRASAWQRLTRLFASRPSLALLDTL